MNIELDKPTLEILEERIATMNFSTVEEYIVNILQQVAKKLKETASQKTDATYSEEDEQKVKARLKSLGYLN